MRRNWLIISLLTTGCVFFILNGCNENKNIFHEHPIISEPTTEATTDSNINSESNNLKPEIKFEKTEVEFGQVGPGTVSTAELPFENIGEGILEIEEITQCCGIMASTDKEQYEPGESGIFTIEYHDGGVIGDIFREPIIHCNDPNNEQVTFTVTAECVQIVVWEPENIKLYLNEENAACPKLTIKSLDEQPFSIKSIKSTGNCITADYDFLVKQSEYVLDLKVDMEKIQKNTTGEISISMTHPQGTIATIYFSVIPKYAINPKSLYMYDLKANEPRHEKINILNNYSKEMIIESTSSQNNHVKMIDYKPVEGGYEMNLEIIPPVPDNETRFDDIFVINLAGGEELSLICRGYYK